MNDDSRWRIWQTSRIIRATFYIQGITLQSIYCKLNYVQYTTLSIRSGSSRTQDQNDTTTSGGTQPSRRTSTHNRRRRRTAELGASPSSFGGFLLHHRHHHGRHRQHADRRHTVAEFAGATASAPRPTRHRAPLPGDPGAAPFRPARRPTAPPLRFTATPRHSCTATPTPAADTAPPPPPPPIAVNWANGASERDESRVTRPRKAKVYCGGGASAAVRCGLRRVRASDRSRQRISPAVRYHCYRCNAVTDRARAANVIFFALRVGSRRGGRTDGRPVGGTRR